MLGRALRLLAIVLGALLVLVVVLGALGILHTYRTPSSSMEPTLRCARPGLGCSASRSDRVLTLRYVVGSPKRGDLIAFHAPPLAAVRCGAGGTFIKRIVAVGGDRFSERSGRVFVNGRPLREPYVPAKLRDSRSVASQRVRAGGLYVLGDNRSASCDSREWGAVPRQDVIGRVVARYWPLRRIGLP